MREAIEAIVAGVALYLASLWIARRYSILVLIVVLVVIAAALP